MKITTSMETSSKQTTNEYPKLMINKNHELIVMFTRAEIGTVFHTEKSNYYPGYYCSDWIMGGFVDFYGKINIVSK